MPQSAAAVALHHRQSVSASEMTYIVSGGALNSTHSLIDRAGMLPIGCRLSPPSPAHMGL